MVLRKYRLKDGSIYWHKLYYAIVPRFLTRYSPPGGDYNYAYYLYNPHQYIRELYLHAKWFIQRGLYGYSDRDVWSLDWHLTGYMGNALRELRDQVHGCPIIDCGRTFEDPGECDSLTLEEWRATILYIADTFDLGRRIEEYDIPGEQMPAAMRRFNHGMAMFNEYFFNLWD